MMLVDPFQLSILYGSMIYQGLFCLVYVWWFMFAAGSVKGSTVFLFGCSQPDHSTLSFHWNPSSVPDPIFFH